MYCTLDELKTRITEKTMAMLSNDTSPSTVDEEVVNIAIESASNLIDGYLLGHGYTLPLTDTQSILKELCLDISTFYLKKRRPPVPEYEKTNFEQALSTLKLIQSGAILLNVISDQTGESITGRANGFFVTSIKKDVIPKKIMDNY